MAVNEKPATGGTTRGLSRGDQRDGEIGSDISGAIAAIQVMECCAHRANVAHRLALGHYNTWSAAVSALAARAQPCGCEG